VRALRVTRAEALQVCQEGNALRPRAGALDAGKTPSESPIDNLGANFTIQVPACSMTALVIPKANNHNPSLRRGPVQSNRALFLARWLDSLDPRQLHPPAADYPAVSVIEQWRRVTLSKISPV